MRNRPAFVGKSERKLRNSAAHHNNTIRSRVNNNNCCPNAPTGQTGRVKSRLDSPAVAAPAEVEVEEANNKMAADQSTPRARPVQLRARRRLYCS